MSKRQPPKIHGEFVRIDKIRLKQLEATARRGLEESYSFEMMRASVIVLNFDWQEFFATQDDYIVKIKKFLRSTKKDFLTKKKKKQQTR